AEWRRVPSLDGVGEVRAYSPTHLKACVSQPAIHLRPKRSACWGRPWRIAPYGACPPFYLRRMTRSVATEETLRRRLAANVRTARNASSLTLKVASARVEMHWRHWQKIEAGEVNVTLHTLARLGDVLDIDPSNLLREVPSGSVKRN